MKTSAATEPASCVALSSGRAARIPRFPCWEGNNGAVNAINNQGAVAGEVENNVRDPDYEAVIWGPAAGQIRVHPPLPSDTVSAAFWINDAGQAVGVSG